MSKNQVLDKIYQLNRHTLFFANSDYLMFEMHKVIPDFHYVVLTEGPEGFSFRPTAQLADLGSFTAISNFLVESSVKDQLWLSALRNPLALFLMYDQNTYHLVHRNGMTLGHCPPPLYHQIDNKIYATQIAERVGIPVVNYQIVQTSDNTRYEDLKRLLGTDWVVQFPYGCSGETTFFVSNKEQWLTLRKKSPQQLVKVMQKIRSRSLAVDACVCRGQTLVGPVVSELIGHPALTPFPLGWCGNQVIKNMVSIHELRKLRIYVESLGNHLNQLGFSGYFSVDFLYNLDTEMIVFGEINPRISGVATITNLAMSQHGFAPLIAYHILSQMGSEDKVDVSTLNSELAEEQSNMLWSQIILKNQHQKAKVLQVPERSIDKKTGTIQRKTYFITETKPGQNVQHGAELGNILSDRYLYNEDSQQLNLTALELLSNFQSRFSLEPCNQ